MDRVQEVRIYREHTPQGGYDRIKVVIGDLHLRCDVTNGRDARMARRLAESHGAQFFAGAQLEVETYQALEMEQQEKEARLLRAIRQEQIFAGESAVIEDLKRMGLA